MAARTHHGVTLIGPLLADTSAQARASNGYARADFTIDYDTETALLRCGVCGHVEFQCGVGRSLGRAR